MKSEEFILILGSIPNQTNEKDGMIQREIAIDSILSGYNRIYVQKVKQSNMLKQLIYKMRNFFKARRNKLEIFNNKKVKLNYIVSDKSFYKLLEKANKIYCHSLYFLVTIPKELIKQYSNKIIVDIHGCVVEELMFQNVDESIINNFKLIEKIGFSYIKNWIAVSENMKNFYQTKYPQTKGSFIILPIFDNHRDININFKDKTNLNVVYSGGTQKWQNIDIMLDSMSRINEKYHISILTPDIKIFEDKINQIKNLHSRINLQTVPSNQLVNYYKSMDFGYVLRDDCVVNNVACPTKIIEYFKYGIIPIILQPIIGDFKNLGYSYILNDDFVNGNLPSAEELLNMRINNYNVLKHLYELEQKGKRDLEALLKR